MNVEYLVQLLGNRLNALLLSKDQAFMAGDLERINALDTEINSVNDTLYKLKLLNGISAAANAAGTSETNIVASGISTIVDNGGAMNDAIKCLELYDITSYATDPLHEEKISSILAKMPMALNSPESIDQYIQNFALSSPVSGAMVLAAVQIYAVDQRLMLALMELDSRFGTLGIAVVTKNPGNVGNTGSDTRTYDTWPEGVTAVAEWLSRHHTVVLAKEEIKGEIIYSTVPTSTIAVPTTTVPQNPLTSTIPEAPTPTIVPEPTPTTTPLEQFIEKIISPTSSEPVVTTTAEIPIVPAVSDPTTSSVVEVITSTDGIIPPIVESTTTSI